MFARLSHHGILRMVDLVKEDEEGVAACPAQGHTMGPATLQTTTAAAA
jgi:hypothetical protein